MIGCVWVCVGGYACVRVCVSTSVLKICWSVICWSVILTTFTPLRSPPISVEVFLVSYGPRIYGLSSVNTLACCYAYA